MKTQKIEDLRKRGADMAQALLWAAFALLVVVTALYAFTVVDIRRSKAATTESIAAISGEIRGVFTNSEDFSGLNNDFLINAGSVPVGNVRDTNGVRTIVLPHGGALSFAPGNTQHTFNARIDWAVSGRTPLALCLHIASTGTGEAISGPLGVDYEIERADCYAESPYVTAIYHR